MIPVTKTFFPPIEDYQKQLERIWQNQWLTNRGDLVRELELKLKELLNVPNITLTTNGTLPIQIALKALGDGGEILTTPFSYVATTSAIVWENCTPIFVDIDPEFLTIDETKIEAAITHKTTAILATHVFGNPCNVEEIEKIGRKYNIKVIYDAAHCFGVEYKGMSIFNFGDISTCSFHATKLFHTGEGGAFFCKELELNHKLFYSHNFGHKGSTEIEGVGINAKMSELQAAMGLSNLPFLEEILRKRKLVVEFYNTNLNLELIKILKIRSDVNWNYSYYPVIFKDEEKLLEIQEKLKNHNIYPRRYFYPSLNLLNYVVWSSCPVSEEISKRILCLPLYHSLTRGSLERIVREINLAL